MKKIKQVPMALALSLLGASLSLSAHSYAKGYDNTAEVKEIHTIEVEVEESSEAKIFIDINGDAMKFDVPKEALNDPAQLEQLLADVPPEAKDKLMQSLSSLSLSTDHLNVDESDQKVFIIDIENEHGEHLSGDMKHKIIKKFAHENLFVQKGGKVGADSIIHMLSRGEYSAEELNKIQKALDSKR